MTKSKIEKKARHINIINENNHIVQMWNPSVRTNKIKQLKSKHNLEKNTNSFYLEEIAVSTLFIKIKTCIKTNKTVFKSSMQN